MLIDLLSGSPPSSPSPTLRSQESGFEESPDVWKSWPDSAVSTPQIDWTLTSNSSSSLGQANVDPWSMEWPSQTETAGWADFGSANLQQQRQISEVRSTTMPAISTSALSTSSSTFHTAATAIGAAPQTVKSAPSMPTIIRAGAPKKPVKKVRVEQNN